MAWIGTLIDFLAASLVAIVRVPFWAPFGVPAFIVTATWKRWPACSGMSS